MKGFHAGFLLVALALLLMGCSTMDRKRSWSENATFTPGSERIVSAARRAALDPGTWLPAAAAGVFLIDDLDQRVGEWAYKNSPVFGSPENALKRSDDLVEFTGTGALVTGLLTPTPPGTPWIQNKAGEVFVGWTAVETTIAVTGELKSTVGRRQPSYGTRPEGTDSFVSNHATRPFAHLALVRKNTNFLGIPPWLKNIVDSTFGLAATGSAWGRVEGGLHFPSDQLAGAAIGNFLAMFVHNALLDGDQRWQFAVQPGNVRIDFTTPY